MFAWDIRKAIQNFEKHGVPFEEAATAFVIRAVWTGKILRTPSTNAGSSGSDYPSLAGCF